MQSRRVPRKALQPAQADAPVPIVADAPAPAVAIFAPLVVPDMGSASATPCSSPRPLAAPPSSPALAPAQPAAVPSPMRPLPPSLQSLLDAIRTFNDAHPDDEATLAQLGKCIAGLRRRFKAARRPNHGKPWTEADRGRVMALYREGKSYEAMATALGRYARACQFAVDSQLVRELTAEGLTVEQLAARYGRTVEAIQRALSSAHHGSV